jgi:phospholipid-binding lipoprotein MlaA
MRPSLVRRLLILGSAATVLSAASPCAAAAIDPYDPWEKVNRQFFAIERVLDRHVVGPLAHAYGKMPAPLRAALRNFGRNLGEPVVAVNDVLQGHIGSAASTLGRFAINSTVGIAGLTDPATAGGVPHHDNDFGTTLGRWGAQPGPYLYLPLVGPSTLRDGLGRVADIGLNPLTYVEVRDKVVVSATTVVIDGLDRRLSADRELSTIFATSVDPYAVIRSYYLQSRQAEITGNTELGPLPEFDEPGPPPEPPAAGAPTLQPEPAAPPTSPPPDAASPVPEAGPEPPPPGSPPCGSACQAPP